MFVVISSPYGTDNGAQGLRLAADMAADVILLGPGAGHAAKGCLGGFCGAAFAAHDDLAAYCKNEMEDGVRVVTMAELVALMATGGACGAF